MTPVDLVLCYYILYVSLMTYDALFENLESEYLCGHYVYRLYLYTFAYACVDQCENVSLMTPCLKIWSRSIYVGTMCIGYTHMRSLVSAITVVLT